MQDQSNLVQWQKVDPQTGLIWPWFTHDMLDVISKWDLSDKTVLEYGGGRSTAWWRKKTKWVTTVEANLEWAHSIVKDCHENSLHNGKIYYVGINEGDSIHAKKYTEAGKQLGPYHIVIVDGILRYECLQYALTLPRPLTLIADNFDQDYVWISPHSIELMKPYDINVFEQKDHTDNEGKKWKTVYWELK